jgi:spoIIIJ-associated protein
MIDDLIFRGRNLDEALEKSANFFGVQRDRIRYQIIEDGPEEVAIRLIENPMMPRQGRQYKESDRTFASGYREEPEQLHHHQRQHGHSAANHGNQQHGSYDIHRNHQDGPQQRRPQRPQQNRNDRAPQGRDNRNFQRRDNNYGGRGRQQQNYRGQRNNNHDRRPQNHNSRPPRDNWKPETVDTSALHENERNAFAFVLDILKNMNLRVNLNFSQDQARLIFNITGPDRGLLLTKKGEPLISIQYLVNKIFLGPNEDAQPIFVDSMGYRIARDEELAEIAVMSAERVLKTQREYVLSPMNPYERRIIHLAIKEFQGVFTESQGDGYIKKVAIYPGEK